MKLPSTIFVSTHALRRWQERVPGQGKASIPTLVVALKNARRIGKKELLPIPRVKGMAYFQDGPSGAFLMVEMRDCDECCIVTVIMPDTWK